MAAAELPDDTPFRAEPLMLPWMSFFGPHSPYLCHLLASFFSMEGLLDMPFHCRDPFINAAKLRVQSSK
jgi:hypothetical protein